jgi:hypothetical protein
VTIDEEQKLLEEALVALRPFADCWDAERDMFSTDKVKPAASHYKRAYKVFRALVEKVNDVMDCGHEVKYIVYSERRNYCAICGVDARPRNIPFSKP